MLRIRVSGGDHHREAFDNVDKNSVLTLVREPTNSYDTNAIMVLSDNNHIGYVSRAGGKKVVNNTELLSRISNIEQCKVVLHKKYNKYIYAEVIDMNEYSFCIEKMKNEQIRDLTISANKSIISDKAKDADLIIGGLRHRLAHKEGIKPQVGEICHLERKWNGKVVDGARVKESHCEPGDKGTVHLVSNENGYSYGTLVQSNRKLNQLKRLGITNSIMTNQKVRDDDYYLNPYTSYKIIEVLEGNFVFVERIGPNRLELITGRHNYERVY